MMSDTIYICKIVYLLTYINMAPYKAVVLFECQLLCILLSAIETLRALEDFFPFRYCVSISSTIIICHVIFMIWMSE